MTHSMNRRMFLRGASGAVMAIPFLPSLTSKAFAQDGPQPPVGKNFLAICSDHGDVWGANQYPSDAILTQTLAYAGRDVRYGPLPTVADANGRLTWSAIYNADAQRLPPQLARKFNVMKGLDIPYRIGHHRGGQLGNFVDVDSPFISGVPFAAYQTATIDQVMAYSDNVYSPTDRQNRMTHRSFNLVSGRFSQNFTSPSTRSGNVVQQRSHRDNLELYNHLFDPGSAFNDVNQTILDHVKNGYNRLRRHPRISRGDIARLDQHVERMFEIERKLLVAQNLQNSPEPPPVNSTRYSNNHSFWHNTDYNISYCDLMADMVVAAFETGTSRIATWDTANTHFTNATVSDWHGQVAHGALGATAAQALTVGHNQGIFEHIMVAVARKLDAVQAADGQTLLDHSLIQFTSEAGQYTHHTGCVNYPIVTAGSAGGALSTGHFVDFSNRAIVYPDLDERIAGNPSYQAESPGLYYNQWLATALSAMGVQAEEYGTFRELTNAGPERSAPTGGYGHHHVDAHRAQDYAAAKAVMSQPVPIVTPAV